jgi:hypothetical protein
MIGAATQTMPGHSIEEVLGAELATGDAQIGSFGPILRHLLANDERSVFSDEIVARIRGMIADVAHQLLDETAAAAGQAGDARHSAEAIEALSGSFVANPSFLAHCHALAIEWQLTERLQARLALDPVLSPLLQALIASPDPATASSAMALLAAQSRFAQSQRRMQLPLAELPGDLLHAALVALRTHADGTQDHAAQAEAAIRKRYDEGRSRLGLIARIITAMGGAATASLSVSHAGVAMFLTALALGSGQDRDVATLATGEGQLARLALALCAAGLRPVAIAEQFAALHPDVALPEGFEQLGADRAAALLTRSAVYPGG